MRLPTLLIADDHTILTEGLVSMLKDQFDVVGTVADGEALIEAADKLRLGATRRAVVVQGCRRGRRS